MKLSVREVRSIVRSALTEMKHFEVDPKHIDHPQFVWMPIDKITKNTDVWSDEKLDAVRNQTAKSNVIQPLRLTRDEQGHIHVDDGIHRLNVAKELGHTHVPALWTDYFES